MKYLRIAFLLTGMLTGKIISAQSITVTITSPTGGSSFGPGNSISLSATATDASGTITQVAFYQGTTLLGNGIFNGTGYNYTWNNVAAGIYAITAKATDNNSNTQTSTPVNISVSNSPYTNNWIQGGNAFGAEGILGTTDSARLILKTKNIERMTVLANGNVGIGTASPQSTLHIAGSLRVDSLKNNPAGDYVLSTDTLGNIQKKLLSQPSSSNYFDNGLTANGDEVYLGGFSERDLDLQYSSNDSQTYFGSPINGVLHYYNNSGEWDMLAYYENSSQSGVAGLYTSLDYGNSFYTHNQFNSNDNYYSFSTNINQYSGTEGPGISLTVTDSTGNYDNGIQIYSTGMDLNTKGIQLNYFLNTPAMDSVLVTDSLGNLRQKAISSFGSGSNGHWKLNGNTTYDTLDNIGIGTANPQSKLAVNGTITALKVKVTQTGWADYVFDSAYALPPLAQVQKYIQANKHLQDIPSAAEVECNGIDLGNNQAALLKKVEELTLYIIEQNKKSDEQDKRIKDLEEKLNKLLSAQNLLK